MMVDFTEAAKNLMLNALGGTNPPTSASHVALFDETDTEISGGDPAYARQSVTWAAASGGEKANSAQVSFNVPAGTTVRSWGAYSASSGGTQHVGPKATRSSERKAC
jgi:hypothetical protein